MPFKSLLNNYKEELLDLIFPRICLGCKKHIVSRINKYICQDCLRKITIPEPPFCSYCGVSICNDYSNVCAECRGPQKKFRRGFTASLYKNEMRDFIHAFKYNSHIHLKHDLGALMVGFAGRNIDVSKIDAIVPVPLDRKKLRDRGFNQSQELSNFLSKDFNVPLLSKVLYRKHKEATPQVNLSRRDRVNNIRNAFYVLNKERVADKTILLVDDVFTTGATVNECSKMLLDAGAREIWIFTLSRSISLQITGANGGKRNLHPC